MKKKYTKAYILSNRGCHSRETILQMDFMKAKDYTYEGIINSKSLSLSDKFWWLIGKTNLSKDKKIDIAIQCAETVLPIFEEKYPNDDRPRKAIEAAKNKTDAAYAADAAAAAYDAAADAAAAYAAAYAYAADAATKYKKRLIKILKSVK